MTQENSSEIAAPECSRCGTTDGVHLRIWCAECGPIHLCNKCDQYHADEMAESDEVRL